eukprot:2862813-Rhodomonas_salina.1
MNSVTDRMTVTDGILKVLLPGLAGTLCRSWPQIRVLNAFAAPTRGRAMALPRVGIPTPGTGDLESNRTGFVFWYPGTQVPSVARRKVGIHKVFWCPTVHGTTRVGAKRPQSNTSHLLYSHLLYPGTHPGRNFKNNLSREAGSKSTFNIPLPGLR